MPAKKAKTAPAEEQDLGYEESMVQLEALVERMEAGELSLEQTLEAFERGMALHARLEAILKRGEQRIEMLQSRNGEPDPSAEWVPFEIDIEE